MTIQEKNQPTLGCTTHSDIKEPTTVPRLAEEVEQFQKRLASLENADNRKNNYLINAFKRCVEIRKQLLKGTKEVGKA